MEVDPAPDDAERLGLEHLPDGELLDVEGEEVLPVGLDLLDGRRLGHPVLPEPPRPRARVVGGEVPVLHLDDERAVAAPDDDEVGPVAVDERLDVDLALIGEVVEERVEEGLLAGHERDLEGTDGLPVGDALCHQAARGW